MSEQTKQPATHLVMTVESAQAMLNYLTSRPYGEVSKLVELLTSANLVNLQEKAAESSEQPSEQA
jgi:recombinational DNA repair protein (RecF pathway)